MEPSKVRTHDTVILWYFLVSLCVLYVYVCVKDKNKENHMIIFLLHVGTFLGRSGAESETDCEACYPGFFCPSWAQTSLDLLCPPGWFCPAGSVSGHQPGTLHIIRGQLRFDYCNLCTSPFLFFFFTQDLITCSKSCFQIEC